MSKLKNSKMEVLENSVRQRSGFKAIARHLLRNATLDAAALLAALSPNPRGLRCLYLHYVFDDQRSDFERKIAALLRLGEFVSTRDMVAMIRGEVPVDGTYFHLSFDDGLACVGRNAVPVLDAHSVPAIVFVNSAVVESPVEDVRSSWNEATNYKMPLNLMTWQALSASGLEVGAHTRHHRRLSSISGDPAMLASEIAGCRSDIETHMGRDCRYFAWPYGTLADVDRPSVEAIRKAGFDAAFGVYRYRITPGSTNPFMIPRHHFEPQWPTRHVTYFARGGMERSNPLPDWGLT
jgi:peptidoglycan/xylan/chitin deacetylase (PgdA/CDA1 family)